MRKTLLCTLLALASASATAGIDYYATEGVEYESVVVKFSASGLDSLQHNQLTRSGDPRHLVSGSRDQRVTFDKMFDRPAPESRMLASRDDGGLDRYFEIRLPQDKTRDVDYINRLIERLEQEQDAEAIYPSIRPTGLDDSLSADIGELPPIAIYTQPGSGRTIPRFTDQQYYMKAPDELKSGYRLGGINAFAAHAKYPASKGKGITLVSKEIGRWNTQHVNLPQPAFSIGVVKNPDDFHDTSSVGIMLARDTGFGIIGIASEATAAWNASPATDLIKAIDSLKPGDVVQVGIHINLGPLPAMNCSGSCYVPMEYQRAWFDAMKMATDRGIHVIQAAGNGSLNLDHPYFKGIFDRKIRDSGTIMAGAVCSTSGARAGFSNYGSRIDSSSWGCFDVVTTTVGESTYNLWNGKNQQYTASFSGTSASNPIVAGAAASISAVAKQHGKTLSPPALRQLLTQTGTPLNSAGVGTQPDLLRALNQLTADEVAKESASVSGLQATTVQQGQSTLSFTLKIEGDITLEADVTDASGAKKGTTRQRLKDGSMRVQIALTNVNAGSHKLRYTAVNTKGNRIAVGEQPFALTGGTKANAWDAKKTYAQPCNLVSYQGKEWLNGWWTVNNKPGSDGTWGVWRMKGDRNMHGSCR